MIFKIGDWVKKKETQPTFKYKTDKEEFDKLPNIFQVQNCNSLAVFYKDFIGFRHERFEKTEPSRKGESVMINFNPGDKVRKKSDISIDMLSRWGKSQKQWDELPEELTVHNYWGGYITFDGDDYSWNPHWFELIDFKKDNSSEVYTIEQINHLQELVKKEEIHPNIREFINNELQKQRELQKNKFLGELSEKLRTMKNNQTCEFDGEYKFLSFLFNKGDYIMEHNNKYYTIKFFHHEQWNKTTFYVTLVPSIKES